MPGTLADRGHGLIVYALMGALLAAICVGYETLRTHIPLPRHGGFLIVTWLYELAVLGILALMWHGLLRSIFRVLGWVIIISLAILVILALLALATVVSRPALAQLLLDIGFNQLALSLYVYLGLYRPVFPVVVLSAGVLLLCVHLFRYSWLRKGWIYGLAGTRVRTYLGRYPDARHYLALRAIHWNVFGHATVDSQYENTLRDLIRSQQAALDAERLERCKVRLWAMQGDAWFPRLHRQLHPHHRCKTNLARYLTAPVAHPDGQSPVPRLLEAAEVYYELQMVCLPEGSRPSEDQHGSASSEARAHSLELEIYEHLLGKTECRPHPPQESFGVWWNVFFALYERCCRLWPVLPVRARELLCFDPQHRDVMGHEGLTPSQQQLVRFLVEPSDRVDDLLRALSGNDLHNATTRRLVWLAVAKWMALVEGRGQLYYEVLIDGHSRLRRAGLPIDFWLAETPFEGGPDDRNWLQKLCATKLGIAWLNYSRSLDSIHGSDVYRNFAYRQGISNLTAGNPGSLLIVTGQARL